MPASAIDEDAAEAGYWRARAGQAEALVAELRADKAGLTARVAELTGRVARLQESVTTLSRLLFGSSSEKGGSPSRRNGRDGGGRPGGAGKRGSGRTAGHVHADETSWQAFEDVAGKDGHRWWLWVFVTDQTSVFVMDTSRGAEVAAGQLGIDREQTALEAGRRLVISSDFHKAYQSLVRIGGADPLWCWAHIRRYFLRAGAAHPDQLGHWADAWTERIAVLYRAHHALAATTPGTDAHERARGPWQRAFTDIDAHRILQASDARKGLLHPAAAKVVATLNNEWDGLARHQDLPQLPLDNNTAERALRTPVIGRKNFYGSGAEWAARLAADVWTITATAARHDIEPFGLLTGYLQACAEHGGTAPTGAGLDPFLPWTPQGRVRRRPASDPRRDPGPGP